MAALMAGGTGPGPALAFLITGAGTSIGAISGILVITRTRIVALVVGLLFTGAVLLGWLAPLWLWPIRLIGPVRSRPAGTRRRSMTRRDQRP